MSEIAVPDQDVLLKDSLRLNMPSQVNKSGWTGKRKVIGLPGLELWTGRVTIDMLSTEEEEQAWRAFLYSLKGPVNWFKWALPCAYHIGNKPIITGAGTAYTLPLSNMTASTTVLKAGQFLTVPLASGYDRAVCLTADIATDGTGLATASFVPALSELPAIGSTIESKNPFIRMSAVDTALGLDMQDGVSGISFDVEEAR